MDRQVDDPIGVALGVPGTVVIYIYVCAAMNDGVDKVGRWAGRA